MADQKDLTNGLSELESRASTINTDVSKLQDENEKQEVHLKKLDKFAGEVREAIDFQMDETEK